MANLSLTIANLPSEVKTGKYLAPFQCSEVCSEHINITVQPRKISIPSDASDDMERLYFSYNGKSYQASRYTNLRDAVVFSPGDWQRDHIEIELNPEVCREPSFTVNQFLAITGIHTPMLYRECALVHCSYIIVNGKAILFIGKSGAGKSTQASLWQQYRGAKIINGDRALLFQKNGVWYAGGVSLCGSSDICRNESAPILAMIALHQDSDTRIVEYPVQKNFITVFSGTAFSRQHLEEVNLAASLAEKIAREIPVLHFYCRADEEAVRTLEIELVKRYDL